MQYILSILKYSTVQGVAFLVDITVFILLIKLANLDYVLVAFLIARTCSSVLAFWLHANFTFPGVKGKSFTKQAISFLIAVLANAVVSAICLMILLAFGFPAISAKLLSDLAGILVTYLMLKHVTFASRREHS